MTTNGRRDFSKLSDEELLQLFAGADGQAAFGAIYERYHRYVYQVCWRILRREEIVNEVSQDVFIKVYTKTSDFRGDSSFKTWLTTVIRNTCFTMKGKLKRELTLPKDEHEESDSVFDLLASEALDAADSYEQTQQRRAIRECMAALPPDQKLVLQLREMEERPYEEIAATIQTPLNTVKTRISRARQKMVSCLKAKGIEPS